MRSGNFGNSKQNKKVKLLVVDDHPLIRQSISSLLDDYKSISLVGEAENGLQAVKCSKSLKPDVILMDIEMPGIDGIEATKIIKLRQPEIKIIGFSNHTELSVAQKMLEAGADFFLTKSCSLDELIDKIKGE